MNTVLSLIMYSFINILMMDDFCSTVFFSLIKSDKIKVKEKEKEMCVLW
jgi:hypothetical protein